ncbi:MAG TPA: hypothetical protein PKN64_04850 [Casimicrobium sp.]|nr:hypothetical protein [Casimicrobium sp.]
MKENAMFAKYWQRSWAALSMLLTLIAGGLGTAANAQPVTVIEYYNTTLDAFIITGRSSEQGTLDALPQFKRTGMSFQAVSAASAVAPAVKVCRFYVNLSSPLANSHFYGLENVDCESLLAMNLPGFNWEGYDFAVNQPADGVCPAGTSAIYRSFRGATSGKTANHRYTTSIGTYTASAATGYAYEQVAFCSTAVTDATFIAPTQCGTAYYPGVRVSYTSIDNYGLSDSWVRFHGPQKIMFNGKLVQPVVEEHAFGDIKTIMLDDSATSWSELGTTLQTETESERVYYLPPTAIPRNMVPGETVFFNRSAAYNPVVEFNSPIQKGSMTFVGMEVIDALGGTRLACKFHTQITTDYPSIALTHNRQNTTWIDPTIGVLKAEIADITNDGFGPGSRFTITATSYSRF